MTRHICSECGRPCPSPEERSAEAARAHSEAKRKAWRNSPEAIAKASARSTPEAIAIRKALRATPEWIAADKARRQSPMAITKFLPLVEGPPGCLAHLAPGKAAQ